MSDLKLPWYLPKDGSPWSITAGSGSVVAFYDACIDKDQLGLRGKILSGACDLSPQRGTMYVGAIAATFASYTLFAPPLLGQESEVNNTVNATQSDMDVSGVAPLMQIQAYDQTPTNFPPTPPKPSWAGSSWNPNWNLKNAFAKNTEPRTIYNVKLNVQNVYINFADMDQDQIDLWTGALNRPNCNALIGDNILITSSIGYQKDQISDTGESKKIPPSLMLPACQEYLLKVGSTAKYTEHDITTTKTISTFAGLKYTNKYTDIYAPGDEVPVLVPGSIADGNEGSAAATTATNIPPSPVNLSPAAAIVAGVVGLMAGVMPTATASYIRNSLLFYSKTVIQGPTTLASFLTPQLPNVLPIQLIPDVGPALITPILLANQLLQITQLTFPTYNTEAAAFVFPQYMPRVAPATFPTDWPQLLIDNIPIRVQAFAISGPSSMSDAIPQAVENLLPTFAVYSDAYLNEFGNKAANILPVALVQAVPIVTNRIAVPTLPPVAAVPYGLPLINPNAYTLSGYVPNYVSTAFNFPLLLSNGLNSVLPSSLPTVIRNDLVNIPNRYQPLIAAGVTNILPISVPGAATIYPPLAANLPAALSYSLITNSPASTTLLDAGNVVQAFSQTNRLNPSVNGKPNGNIRDYCAFPTAPAAGGGVEYTGCLYRDCVPLSTVAPAGTSPIDRAFYDNQYACNPGLGPGYANAQLLFQSVKGFYDDLLVIPRALFQYQDDSGARSATFYQPDSGDLEAFFCSFPSLFGSLYGSEASLTPLADAYLNLRNQFLNLFNNYKDSNNKFYYHFVPNTKGAFGYRECDSDDAGYAQFSYSQNYTWAGGTLYEIFLCPSVLRNIVDGNVYTAPTLASIRTQRSMYQFIAREIAYLLDFSNFRKYSDELPGGVTLVDLTGCESAANTCVPLNKKVILGDCLGMYMESFYVLHNNMQPVDGTVGISNVYGFLQPQGEPPVEDPRLTSLRQQAVNVNNMLTRLIAVPAGGPVGSPGWWVTYSTYICTDTASSWPIVQGYLRQMQRRLQNGIIFFNEEFCASQIPTNDPNPTDVPYRYNTHTGGHAILAQNMSEGAGPNAKNSIYKADVLLQADNTWLPLPQEFDYAAVPIALCPQLFLEEAPTDKFDLLSFFGVLAHEITHTSYGTTDATYLTSECMDWARDIRCDEAIQDPPIYTSPPLIAWCMQILFNQYYLDACPDGVCSGEVPLNYPV